MPGYGKRGHVEVERCDAQLAVFDATKVDFDVRGIAWGEVVELLLREAVKGRLVVLEGEVEVGSGAVTISAVFFER